MNHPEDLRDVNMRRPVATPRPPRYYDEQEQYELLEDYRMAMQEDAREEESALTMVGYTILFALAVGVGIPLFMFLVEMVR